jgi:hypothetical protein
MKGILVLAGTIALFVAANVALVQADFGGDLTAIAALVGVGALFGLSVGRWWAVAVPILWIAVALVDQDPASELSTLGLVLLTALITVPLQAAGVAVGVLARRAPGWHRSRSGLHA